MTTENIIPDPNQQQQSDAQSQAASQQQAQQQQQQQQQEQMVPLSRLNEEIAKRQEAETREAQLREQQLRMMAQQQPLYQPQYPVQQQQQQQPELDDFDNVFTVDPRRAIETKLQAERQRILRESEEMARRTFHTEANKMMARQRYPDLNNPSSEFFKRVSFYMSTHPEKYTDPEGILDACARVKEDMPQPNTTQQQASQRNVQQVAAAASQVGNSTTTQTTDEPRLNPEAQLLAQKLNIDPKKFAQRQKNLEEGKGEYAPAPGKQGKAQFIK